MKKEYSHLKILFLIYVIFTYINFDDLAFASTKNLSCDELLSSFRDEVVNFAQKRAETNPTSTDPGEEHHFIRLDSQKSDHIVYIASGGDIYRPLMNFPRAKHYHLFDVLGGWYAKETGTTNDFINELEARLRELPEAYIEVVDRGFIGVVSQEILDKNWSPSVVEELEREHAKTQALRRPLIYRVIFNSVTYGSVEKLFYLHFGDRQNEDHIATLVKGIPESERLIGSFQVGILGTPHASNIGDLLSRADGEAEFFIKYADTAEIIERDLIAEFKGYLGPGYDVRVYSTSYDPYIYAKYSAWVGVRKTTHSPMISIDASN